MNLKDIINATGRKRFFVLAAFGIVTAALAVLWQQYYVPKQRSVQDEASSVEAQRHRLQGEIAEMPKKYDEQKANVIRYENLQAAGFFAGQDRIEARARMDKVRSDSGLRSISYDIDQQQDVPLAEFPTMTNRLVASHIKVEMKGLSDLEMRQFIRKMTQEFGSLLTLRAVSFEVDEKLSEDMLLRLSRREPVSLVKGMAEFDWYSILPKLADGTTPQTQAFGGQAQ